MRHDAESYVVRMSKARPQASLAYRLEHIATKWYTRHCPRYPVGLLPVSKAKNLTNSVQ